jgi:hypothetical protein
MVLREFLFHQILPLMARPTPMWEYFKLGDPSVVAEGNLPKESMARVAWMVLRFASREPMVGEGPAPFSVYEPRPDDLLYLGVVSILPVLTGRASSPGAGAPSCKRRSDLRLSLSNR